MPDRDDALLQRASDKGQDRPEQEAGAKSKKDKAKDDLRGKPYDAQVGALEPPGKSTGAGTEKPQEQTYVDALGQTIRVNKSVVVVKKGGLDETVSTYEHLDPAGVVIKITRITEYSTLTETHSRYELCDATGKVLHRVDEKRKRELTPEEQKLQDQLHPEEKEQRERAKKQASFEEELKKQYERQFGPKLGKKLYELVTSNLGPSKLLDYAKQGVAEGLKSLQGMAPEAMQAELNKVWGSKAKQIAAGIVGTPEIQSAITWLSNFLREHPYGLMVTALITAALAAMKVYTDNMDLPALEGMFPIGKNVKVGGKLDLGKIQELTVQSLHGYLDVHVGAFSMKLDVGHDEGKKNEDGSQDAGTFSIKDEVSLKLLDKTEKENDATTGQLKREYAQKMSATFGSTFKFDERTWSLDAMELAFGLAIEARDKRLVSVEKLDRLQASEYKETVFSLYMRHLQKYKNVEGSLQPQEISLAMGLSLVMNKVVEIKTFDESGKVKEYKLEPLQYGFNWGINYKNGMPYGTDPTQSVGVEGGFFIKKGNWSLGTSGDYTHDLIKNQNSFGGKITFSISF